MHIIRRCVLCFFCSICVCLKVQSHVRSQQQMSATAQQSAHLCRLHRLFLYSGPCQDLQVLRQKLSHWSSCLPCHPPPHWLHLHWPVTEKEDQLKRPHSFTCKSHSVRYVQSCPVSAPGSLNYINFKCIKNYFSQSLHFLFRFNVENLTCFYSVKLLIQERNSREEGKNQCFISRPFRWQTHRHTILLLHCLEIVEVDGCGSVLIYLLFLTFLYLWRSWCSGLF